MIKRIRHVFPEDSGKFTFQSEEHGGSVECVVVVVVLQYTFGKSDFGLVRQTAFSVQRLPDEPLSGPASTIHHTQPVGNRRSGSENRVVEKSECVCQIVHHSLSERLQESTRKPCIIQIRLLRFNVNMSELSCLFPTRYRFAQAIDMSMQPQDTQLRSDPDEVTGAADIDDTGFRND